MNPEDERRLRETRSRAGEPSPPDPRPSDAAWEVGAVVLERFAVERELGRGGMGVVHLLRNRDTHEPYAVKRSQKLDEAHRARFLQELQVWEQLPDHPNLVRCRFFKTIGSQLAIFAEFVDGTTLDALLRSGALRDAGQILDLSIQLARGLAAAHAAGVVHRDVKPSNVIVTSEGVARVTDFGLSYSRSFSDRAGEEPLGTLPYRSPEQAERRPTDERTDVWSIGVCMLAMLKGGCTWADGVLAPRLLDQLRESSGQGGPSHPRELTELLGECFQAEPDERAHSMELIAGRLERIYESVCGGRYPRSKPEPAAGPAARPLPARADVARFWERLRLRIGPRVPVNDVAAAAAAVSAGGAGEIAALDKIRRLLERLVEGEGRSDLVKDLVETLVLHGDAHRNAGDAEGAIELYRRAAERCERLGSAWDFYRGFLWASMSSCAADDCQDLRLAQEAARRAVQVLQAVLDRGDDRRAAEVLALAWLSDGIALLRSGEHAAALEAFDRSERLLDRLLADGHDLTLLKALATLRRTRAECFAQQGALDEADAEISEAMQIFAQLASQGLPGIAHELATTDLNRSNYLSALGRLEEALPLAQRAATVWEALVGQMGRDDLRGSLARARKNEAVLRERQGDIRGALPVIEWAISAYERLVDAEGRLEHELELAQAFHNKGVLLRKLSRLGDARAALARAQCVYERVAAGSSAREGRLGLAAVEHAHGTICQYAGDLAGAVAHYDRSIAAAARIEPGARSLDAAKELARAHYGRGAALRALGRAREAHSDLDRALELQEDIVFERRHGQLVDELALSYLGKAALFRSSGHAAAAASLCARAVRLLAEATERGARQELKPLLATALQAQSLCAEA